jgi:hypothetical protein
MSEMLYTHDEGIQGQRGEGSDVILFFIQP